MSQLVKNLTVTVLTVFVLLSTGAFAQTVVTNDTNLLPKAAAPSNSSNSDIRAGRLEIGINFGGTSGYSFSNNHVSCTSTVGTQSCDPNLAFTHDGGSGLLPEAFQSLPGFYQQAKLTPGSGVTFGARVGWNFNPSWQVEFQYNHANVDIGWDKIDLAKQAVADFCNPDKFNECFDFGLTDRRVAVFQPGADGSKRGNQDQYLFNVIYNFNEDKKFVPYVGGGAGATHYYNLPSVSIFQTTPNQGCPTNSCSFTYQKFSGSDTAFSFDGMVGAKYYLTRHWGVRAEFQNVVSFTSFDHKFQTIDNDDACTNASFFCGGFTPVTTGAGSLQPPTGKTHQEGLWNHAQFNAGVFWKF